MHFSLAGCAAGPRTTGTATNRSPSSVCEANESRCFLSVGESMPVGNTTVFCGVNPGEGSSPDEKCWDSCLNREHLGSRNCKNTCGLESPFAAGKCWDACTKSEHMGVQNCKNVCGLDFPAGVERCWDTCTKTEHLGSQNCKNVCGIPSRAARDQCWDACTNLDHLGSQNCKNVCGL